MKGALVKVKFPAIAVPAGSICLFLKERAGADSFFHVYHVIHLGKVITIESSHGFSEWFEIIQHA